jgi:hypothetical protein
MMPRWATGLSSSMRPEGDAWVAETESGPVRVRFAPRNGFGVLDHEVELASGARIPIPMRVIPHGEESEVLFTLFRVEGMSDEEFDRDAEWVRRDLETLKALLEA